MKHKRRKRYWPWIIEFLLILAVLQVVKGQNPHDVVMLLQLLLQKHQ